CKGMQLLTMKAASLTNGRLGVFGELFLPLGPDGRLVMNESSPAAVCRAAKEVLASVATASGQQIIHAPEGAAGILQLAPSDELRIGSAVVRSVVVATFDLLNASNVALQAMVSPSKRQQRKGASKGITWHRLVIVKPSVRRVGLVVQRGTGEPFLRAHL